MTEPTTPEPAKKPVRLKCIYGNKIKLKNLTTSEVNEYTLVNYIDEKLKLGHISNYTTIGKAIWAKHEGDEVDIEINGCKDRYQIEKIENV